MGVWGLCWCCSWSRLLVRAPATKQLMGSCPPPSLPTPADLADADIEAYVRKSTCSGNALVGTARMGASPTDGSVVSAADFSVWGVQGLRVIDSSVIPRIMGGQSGAATWMLAERAAEMLATGGGSAKKGAASKVAAMA